METQKGPLKTTVPLKWGYMGFHVSLGECKGDYKLRDATLELQKKHPSEFRLAEIEAQGLPKETFYRV